jgi:hypothetical protein
VNNGLAIAVITVVVVMSAVIWFDRKCLVDLAQTRDWELRHFDRRTWALIIVLSFPIGPFLYLAYAKGPRRP